MSADATVRAAAATTLDALRIAGRTIVTAESCTGGLLAGALTTLPGSSAQVHGGFVTYANEAKTAMLGVAASLIERDGAVSESVVRAMAEGARERTGAGAAVAVTGVAGPGGGSETKPVGTVWFATATGAGTLAETVRFEGDRDAIRDGAVLHALAMVRRAVERSSP